MKETVNCLPSNEYWNFTKLKYGTQILCYYFALRYPGTYPQKDHSTETLTDTFSPLSIRHSVVFLSIYSTTTIAFFPSELVGFPFRLSRHQRYWQLSATYYNWHVLNSWPRLKHYYLSLLNRIPLYFCLFLLIAFQQVLTHKSLKTLLTGSNTPVGELTTSIGNAPIPTSKKQTAFVVNLILF